MNKSDRLKLLSEKRFLEERLVSLSPNARLTRISAESRLASIAEVLARGIDEGEPARINLTFNGKPVIGSHGVFARFGTEAVGKFTDAVDAMVASLTMPLKPMGPIPNSGQQLLITNTAIGSFGFELEEVATNRLPLDDTPVVQALEKTQMLLESTASGSDDELAEIAAETNPRAIDKLRIFLQTLVDNEAAVALEFRNSVFRFNNVEQIRNSIVRLSQENIHEEEVTLHGRFDGYLPSHKTFDFITQEGLITGKAVPGLDEEGLAMINQHLGQGVEIKVLRTKVGQGRPRYRLQAVPVWEIPRDAG